MTETSPISYASPELVQSYRVWTADAITRLRAIAAEWRQQTRPADEARQSAYEIVHNIKGMGSSFGHPLMTEAGRSLCAYLRQQAGADNELTVIDAHLDSFEGILALGPGDHGDSAHARFIAPLHQLTGQAPLQG